MGKRVDKPHNNGQWSKARFNSFIKSTLRRATVRWGPIQTVKKKARVKRGWYFCAGCKTKVPSSLPPDKKGGKRIPNVFVDHINPIIDPSMGFVNWDIVISRMFCEEDGLQLLCKACHDKKTNDEKELAKKRRRYERG